MLYNFMTKAHALGNITRKRLKISRISEANDPYELAAIALSDPEKVAALGRTKDALDREKGLLCFSRDWCSPVIWSHYADRHRGMALGFVRNGEEPAPVTYSPDMLTEDWLLDLLALPEGPERESMVLKWLTFKFEAWEYEHESRVYLDLNEPDLDEPKYYFSYFGPETIDLREVIIGVRCMTSVAVVESLLTENGYTDVKVIKAGLSTTKYEVIEAH